MLDEITPLLITFNEAPNIERTLAALDWARGIVVVDSGSSDETLQILTDHPKVSVFHRPFDTFATQCTFGAQETDILSDWILSLDADHVLTSDLISEFEGLEPSEDIVGYEAEFTYCVFGRPLQGSLYPPRVVLFRRGCASYEDDGHGHRILVDGRTERLQGRILHDDRKPLSLWLIAQARYMRVEAAKISNSRWRDLNLADRLRRTVVLGPPLAFLWALLVKGGIVDGWAGWHYAVQRGIAESVLSLRLIEERISQKRDGG